MYTGVHDLSSSKSLKRCGFYDTEAFTQANDPNNQNQDLFDPLKHIHIGDNWLLSFGGEERVRHMNDHGGYLVLTSGKSNDYTLIRSRVYADLWFEDRFRTYAGMSARGITAGPGSGTGLLLIQAARE